MPHDFSEQFDGRVVANEVDQASILSMRDSLPPWFQYALIPMFGMGIAIPFVATINESSAAFAGGLTAAIVAVIAVVMTAYLNNQNDAKKEARARAAELWAALHECGVYMAQAREELKPVETRLTTLVSAHARAMFMAAVAPPQPFDQGPPNSAWRASLDRAGPRIPDRLVAFSGFLPPPVTFALHTYIRLCVAVREMLALEIAYPPANPLTGSQAADLKKVVTNIIQAATACEHACVVELQGLEPPAIKYA